MPYNVSHLLFLVIHERYWILDPIGVCLRIQVGAQILKNLAKLLKVGDLGAYYSGNCEEINVYGSEVS